MLDPYIIFVNDEDIPHWASKLHVSPDVYAQVAGWTLTSEGNRRNLFYPHCYPLIKAENETEYQNSPVKVAEGYEGKCLWCNRPLSILFDFNLTHSMLKFLQLDGKQLRIVTCDICTGFGLVYANVDWHGGTTWYTGNQKPTYLPDHIFEIDSLPSGRFVLGQHPRNPFSAASDFLPISFSQVGGHPTWIQDAEYPSCPECHRLMDFIAQLDGADIEEYGEGVFYAFLCKACRITVTSYQQT